jgi:antitoxin ParD1/3/4
MNVSLTPELERMVEEKVRTGSYASASEVVREALRLLGRRDARETAKLEALRSEIQKGIDSADAGRRSPRDEAMARLRAKRAPV